MPIATKYADVDIKLKNIRDNIELNLQLNKLTPTQLASKASVDVAWIDTLLTNTANAPLQYLLSLTGYWHTDDLAELINSCKPADFVAVRNTLHYIQPSEFNLIEQAELDACLSGHTELERACLNWVVWYQRAFKINMESTQQMLNRLLEQKLNASLHDWISIWIILHNQNAMVQALLPIRENMTLQSKIELDFWRKWNEKNLNNPVRVVQGGPANLG